MRILIVGAGATGGFYGGKLAQAGRDITFLLRDRRADQVREHGLQILPHRSDPLTLHPKIVTAADLHAHPQSFDLILLSTKAYQLEAAIDDIAPAVGPETMLLPILNGMRQITILTDRFGADRVLGGSVRVVSYLDEENRIVQMSSLDEMSYGELSRAQTPRIQAVDEAMQNAGFTAILQPDVIAALWEKWWILASMGAICILARGTIGQAAEAPRGTELVRAILDEAAAIATANGYPPDPAAYDRHLARTTERGSTLTSSLYRDMIGGAPVEADHILGDLLDRAHGVPAPLLTAAYVQLKVYEGTRS